MRRHFLVVSKSKRGWVVQPCERVMAGMWRFEKSIAGPFKTKKEAAEWKRTWRSLPW